MNKLASVSIYIETDMEVLQVIRLNILELLKKKEKSKYWLNKQLGMSYRNFNRMVNNETKSIQLDRIETLCQLLNCAPNDLFQIDWETPESKG